MGYHRPLVAVAGGVNLAVLSRRIVVDRLRSLRAPDESYSALIHGGDAACTR